MRPDRRADLGAGYRQCLDEDSRAGFPSLRTRIGECDTVNITCSGETSWFGFAEAILDGLRKRNLGATAERVMPIKSEDYPTRAVRPRNSRLDSTRARAMFSIRMPT